MSYEYKQRQILERSAKAFKIGDGRISGYISILLGFLALITVLAYLYPAYLTTAELRQAYDAEVLQQVLKYGMWFSLFFGGVTFVINKRKRMGFMGICLTLLAFGLGGYMVPVGAVEPQALSLGIDWLVLTLLGSIVIFTSLEKLFPRYKEQVILRQQWDLDFLYFCLNHLMISVIILIGNFLVVKTQWAASTDLASFVQDMPLVVQFLMLLLVADFVLYWEHRTFHEVRLLWPFHAVHHSVECLDWLAGSRSHVVQIIIERSLVMVCLYQLGADKAALDAYVVFAALHAVVIHCNLGISFGWLKYLLVTPQYHHWHHSSESPAIDTNYGAHTPLFDRLFSSYHMPKTHWPAEYGTTKKLPRTFIGQFLYPFRLPEYRDSDDS